MRDEGLQKIAEARLGRTLRGKYRLDRVLGIGGMATVYAATHRNSKQFAIKVLHAELSMLENTRARFLREGYLANQVKHPGAVAVLDEDVAEDGSAFIVMELLEGASLDSVWNEGEQRLPLSAVVSVGDALLDVLIAAHARGIVHRDLKPANLFLTSDGALKVLDFGIARLRDDTGSNLTTAPGSIVGTPAFMAPEQLVGKSADVDAQTDLWAVGATLFSLIAGKLVHEGENALQLIADAATRPARSLASVADGVPKPLAQVIDRALRSTKSERWADASEMREALASAWAEASGGPVAPLPKQPASAKRAAAGSFGTPVSGGGSSDPSAFVPTMEASGADARTPLFTTGIGVARARSDVPTRRSTRGIGRFVALGVLACALVGGGVALIRAARAPRVRFCVFVDDTSDGPRCALEVNADSVVERGDAVTERVTEVGGRVVRVEDVNFGGPHIAMTWWGDQATRLEVTRSDDGAVREVVMRSHYGNVERREKWFDGGKRVESVEEDGVTPRCLFGDALGRPQTSITMTRREFDDRGRVTKQQFFAAAGRPASDLRGAYGYAYAYGRTVGTPIRETILGADGAPSVDLRGESVIETADDGTPGGADVRYFDRDGKPVMVSGVHHEHRAWSPAHVVASIGYFGLHEEPVADLESGAHEARAQWDPVKRTNTWTWFDVAGRRTPEKREGDSATRETYDARGRWVLDEYLDAEGNRVYRRGYSSADRFDWDDQDHQVLIERLDVAGAPMQGGGWARQAAIYDALGKSIELREYDVDGKLAPSLISGAITRRTFDARELLQTTSDFDAEGRPYARLAGWSTARVRYDRLRNTVERAYFGPDGLPCIIADGYSVERETRDDNGDALTVAYLDTTGAPTMYKGEYATERVTRDAVGLDAEDEYLDGHGERVLRREGYAAVHFVRDRNGDAVEESYFGKRDEPVVREGGYAKKKTTYDPERRAIETALFGVSGAPGSGSDGWAIERATYDERGLLVREDHLDATRAPVLTKDGSASSTKAYDGRGNEIEATTLGVDGKPIATADGFATKKSAYDLRFQLIEESLFGADGGAASGKEGWSIRRLRYDDKGNQVEEAFFDGEHRPTAPKGAAYTSATSRFDARQRLVETAYFDGTGAPSKGPDGVAAVRYERDANGHAISTTYVDGLGAPVASSDGKIVVRTRYDDAGRVTEELFVDGKGAPLLAKDGCAGHRTKYDRLGRKLEESCVDATGGLGLSADGWAIRRTIRDARGNAVDESTYAADGSLHADKDGIARKKSRFDERNLPLETTYFDANDRPAHDKRGAQAIRFTYDDSGKKTGETAVDERGRTVAKGT